MLNRNHALSVFDPFREIEKVEKSFFDDPWANFGRTFTDSFRTDVTDEGDHFKITADLPGFEKENIHLDLSDDVLTISAQRHSEHENKDKRGKYLCCERSYGTYSRSFNVRQHQGQVRQGCPGADPAQGHPGGQAVEAPGDRISANPRQGNGPGVKTQ